MQKRHLEVRRLGRVDYAGALELQKSFESEVIEKRVQDYLLLLEHPHTYTLGRRAKTGGVLATAEILKAIGAEVFESDRGGKVTYHGIGQLVGYPIVNLSPDREDVHKYVRDLEEVLIRTMADFGIESFRIEGLTGVHTAEGKIAAIGVHIKRWVTTHGFALNVNTDLSYFDWIIACEGEPVTSMERLLGREIALGEVEDRIIENFAAVFGAEEVAFTGMKGMEGIIGEMGIERTTPSAETAASSRTSRGELSGEIMKYMKLFIISIALAAFSACGGPGANNANQTNSNPAATQTLSVVERPQAIKDKMAARGEQDSASPVLTIVEPKELATVNSSTVKVKLELSGDLKGYKPGMDEATHTGNHIHVILDNQPYEAYYNIEGGPFELRNVSDGTHTLRVFPSRPWHESYKNPGAFAMVNFSVSGGAADPKLPVTTNSGQQMSNANSNANADAKPTPEGKDMQFNGQGTLVNAGAPLLTYSRPKGEYKGADTDAVMIDFWLWGAKLKGDGGEYRVRWSVDGGEAKFIDKWEPIWLAGWTAGKHTVKLELIDAEGRVAIGPIGPYNSTSREITITK